MEDNKSQEKDKVEVADNKVEGGESSSDVSVDSNSEMQKTIEKVAAEFNNKLDDKFNEFKETKEVQKEGELFEVKGSTDKKVEVGSDSAEKKVETESKESVEDDKNVLSADVEAKIKDLMDKRKQETDSKTAELEKRVEELVAKNEALELERKSKEQNELFKKGVESVDIGNLSQDAGVQEAFYRSLKEKAGLSEVNTELVEKDGNVFIVSEPEKGSSDGVKVTPVEDVVNDFFTSESNRKMFLDAKRDDSVSDSMWNKPSVVYRGDANKEGEQIDKKVVDLIKNNTINGQFIRKNNEIDELAFSYAEDNKISFTKAYMEVQSKIADELKGQPELKVLNYIHSEEGHHIKADGSNDLTGIIQGY